MPPKKTERYMMSMVNGHTLTEGGCEGARATISGGSLRDHAMAGAMAAAEGAWHSSEQVDERILPGPGADLRVDSRLADPGAYVEITDDDPIGTGAGVLCRRWACVGCGSFCVVGVTSRELRECERHRQDGVCVCVCVIMVKPTLQTLMWRRPREIALVAPTRKSLKAPSAPGSARGCRGGEVHRARDLRDGRRRYFTR